MRGDQAKLARPDLQGEIFSVDTALRKATADEPKARPCCTGKHVSQLVAIAEGPDRTYSGDDILQSGRSGFVRSFGRREAYESLRGTNPRSADDGLWVFLFSAERVEVTIGSGRRGT